MTTQNKVKKDISFFEEKENFHAQPSTVKIKTSELMTIHSVDRVGIVFLIIFSTILSYNTFLNYKTSIIDALLSTPLFTALSFSLIGAVFSNIIFSRFFKGNKKLNLISQTRNELQCVTNIEEFRFKIKKFIAFLNQETVTYKNNYNSLHLTNTVPFDDIETVLGNNISLIEDTLVFAESILNPALNVEAISSLNEEKIIGLRNNIILIVNDNYFNRELLGVQMRKIISATNVFSKTNN